MCQDTILDWYRIIFLCALTSCSDLLTVRWQQSPKWIALQPVEWNCWLHKRKTSKYYKHRKTGYTYLKYLLANNLLIKYNIIQYDGFCHECVVIQINKLECEYLKWICIIRIRNWCNVPYFKWMFHFSDRSRSL